MAFEVKSQHVDKALGNHIVHLHDNETGAHHIVQILIGHSSCPLCGHVKLLENVDELDPKEIVRAEIDNLHQSHNKMHAYAKKHGVPVKAK